MGISGKKACRGSKFVEYNAGGMGDTSSPLAERLRPKTIDEIVGQGHLVGKNGVIRKMLDAKFLPSIVLWGPPGSGKTTIARLLADQINAVFASKSAVTSSLADIREVIKQAKIVREQNGTRTVLFIDEIHRFNKAQQDALLPHVEDGTVIFIGATTENPSFEVISPLLSRSRVLVLHQLSEDDLNTLITRGEKEEGVTVLPEGKEALKILANGDARQMLTILEIAGKLSKNRKKITRDDIETASQKSMLQYDTAGEEHYNTISAFIKSMRASDPDATLYYLARMVAAGEEPLFIARRMVIFASEDIGLAQPTALVVANAVFAACQTIGYPECQENLAHGAVYLALAKKDRSAYEAYMEALHDATQLGNLPIPLSIRNAPTKLMKDLGYGKDYQQYSTESHLPDKIKGKTYLKPKT